MKEITFPPSRDTGEENTSRGPFIQVVNLGCYEISNVFRNKGVLAIDESCKELVYLAGVEI